MSEILLNGMPFDDYLAKYEIFEKTTQFMMEYLKKTICMTRLCSALLSVWISLMMRVIIRQFTPHFLTLTATALTTN